MIEISLKSSDLVYLSCTLYEAINTKAVVQIIPGIKEHKSRYIDLITDLNNAGFTVFISDLRGHGRSVNGNYPLGYLDDASKLIEDQNIICDYLRNRYAGLPIYMIGDSLGADVALGFIQKYDVKIQKLLLCSPLKYDKKQDLWVNAASIAMKFKKGTQKSPMIEKALGDWHLEVLVKDVNERERIKKDPLCNFDYSLLAMYNFLILNKGVRFINRYQGTNKDLPIQILFGAQDELTGGREGIKSLIMLFNQCGYMRIGNLEFANMQHKILFETGKKLVYNEIIKFFQN